MALHETAQNPRLTRRAVLSLSAASAIATAGCTTLTEEDDPDDQSGPSVPDEEDVISGVEAHYFRFDTDSEVVEFENIDDPGYRRHYVRSEEHIDAVTFHGEPLGDEDPEETLWNIDYEESTALVLSRTVNGCTKQSLNYVKYRGQHPSDGLRVRLCSTYRDPDVECSTDDSHTQVTVLDVPVTLDARPSGFGHGGSSSCDLPIEHPANDGANRSENDGGEGA